MAKPVEIRASFYHLLTLPELLNFGKWDDVRLHMKESGILIPDVARNTILRTIESLSRPRKAPALKLAAILKRGMEKNQIDRCISALKVCGGACQPFLDYANLDFRTKIGKEFIQVRRFRSDQTPYILQLQFDFMNLISILHPLPQNGKKYNTKEIIETPFVKWPFVFADFLTAYARFIKGYDPANPVISPDMRIARDQILELIRVYLRSEDQNVQLWVDRMQKMFQSENVHLLFLPLNTFMLAERPMGVQPVQEGDDPIQAMAVARRDHQIESLRFLPTLQQNFSFLTKLENMKRTNADKPFTYSISEMQQLVAWMEMQLARSDVDREFNQFFGRSFKTALLQYITACIDLPQFSQKVYDFQLAQEDSDDEGEELECNFHAVQDAGDYYINYLETFSEKSHFIHYMCLLLVQEGCLKEIFGIWKKSGYSTFQFDQFLRQEVPVLGQKLKANLQCAVAIGQLRKTQPVVSNFIKEVKVDRDFAQSMMDLATGCFSLALEFCEGIISSPEWQSSKVAPAPQSALENKDDGKVDDAEAPAPTAAAPLLPTRRPPAMENLPYIETALLSPLNAYKAKLKKEAQASVDNATGNIKNVILLMNRLLQDVHSPERTFETIAHLISESNYAVEQLLLASDLQHNPVKDLAELRERRSHSFFELYRKSYHKLKFFDAKDRAFIYYQLDRAEIAIRTLGAAHGRRHVASLLFAPALQFAERDKRISLNDLLGKTEAFLNEFLRVAAKFAERGNVSEAFQEQLRIYFHRLRDSKPAPHAGTITPFAGRAHEFAQRIQMQVENLNKAAPGIETASITNNLLLRLRTELSRHGELRPEELPLFVSHVMQEIYLIAEQAVDGLCSIRQKGLNLSRHDFNGRLQALGLDVLQLPPPVSLFLANSLNARNIARYWSQYQDHRGPVQAAMQNAVAISKHPKQELFQTAPEGFQLKMSDSQKRFQEIEKTILEHLAQLEQFIAVLQKTNIIHRKN